MVGRPHRMARTVRTAYACTECGAASPRWVTAARAAAPGTPGRGGAGTIRPGQGVRPGDGPGPHHRGRRPDRRPPAHRRRGAWTASSAAAWSRGRWCCWPASPHRQVDPAAGGAGRPRRRRPGAVRLRRGVARAGPPGPRHGGPAPGPLLAAETDLGPVRSLVEQVRPDVVEADLGPDRGRPRARRRPGGVGQVREVAAQLVRLAKERSIATFLVGQVTKDGAVAGPKTLEHLVDVVLNFEGDQHHALRLVRCTKNRFGPAYEVGCFEMTEAGLEPVADPSRLSCPPARPGCPGSPARSASRAGGRSSPRSRRWSCPSALPCPGAPPRGWTPGGWPSWSPCSTAGPASASPATTCSPPPPAGSGSPSPPPTWPSAWPWPRPPATGRCPPSWSPSARSAWAARSARCPSCAPAC